MRDMRCLRERGAQRYARGAGAARRVVDAFKDITRYSVYALCCSLPGERPALLML